mmetsp:Transcript_13795/g.18867  ORF Transcript_13795/g.18867 Transcript_13795/m.18867 type:complete len:113 (-) Transcript_13795:66-404(-)
MAKGLRSKSKRKNRAALRATLSEPIIKQRQENMAEELKNNLEMKSGDTIVNLKNVLNISNAVVANSIIDHGMENDLETDEATNSKLSIKSKPKVFKGSRKSRGSNKTLVWFK